MTADTDARLDHVSIREYLAMPGFRRLLICRFAAQWSDGLFRTGLAGALLFNPERGTDPLTIAAGFATLLVPYSVLGPFAGALLDRWDRRRVLVVANLLRAVAVLAAVVAFASGLDGLGLFSLALIVEGLSRFVGSGLSASLPQVVPSSMLVSANALATTSGSLIAVLGGGCAIALRAIFGADDLGAAWVTSFAILGPFLAAWFAAQFARNHLGPVTVDEPSDPIWAVIRGLVDGAKATLRAPRVTAGFVALFAHRAAYAISLLLSVLLLRFAFVDHGLLKAGLPGLAQLGLMAGTGILLAGFCTPRLVRKFGRNSVIMSALAIALVTQLALGLPMELWTTLLAALLIMATGQVIKLCVDSVIQQDVDDASRGRVFALYDTLFNLTMVVAVSITAAITPLDGRSRQLIIAAGLLYLMGVAGYWVITRRIGTPPPA